MSELSLHKIFGPFINKDVISGIFLVDSFNFG